MSVRDDLRCLFTERLTRHDGSYVIKIPAHEVEYGTLQPGDLYRIAMLEGPDADTDGPRTDVSDEPTPPVSVGETREVEIEDRGEQGDGIARVERGYVLIVSGTEPGDTVTVRVTDVQPNFAFAEPVDTDTEGEHSRSE